MSQLGQKRSFARFLKSPLLLAANGSSPHWVIHVSLLTSAACLPAFIRDFDFVRLDHRPYPVGRSYALAPKDWAIRVVARARRTGCASRQSDLPFLHRPRSPQISSALLAQ